MSLIVPECWKRETVLTHSQTVTWAILVQNKLQSDSLVRFCENIRWQSCTFGDRSLCVFSEVNSVQKAVTCDRTCSCVFERIQFYPSSFTETDHFTSLYVCVCVWGRAESSILRWKWFMYHCIKLWSHLRKNLKDVILTGMKIQICQTAGSNLSLTLESLGVSLPT